MFFLSKGYILSNELVQKMGIHIANISMLRQHFEEADDFASMIKMNNCTFINSKAVGLPRNIRSGVDDNTFTDVSNKLPCTFVRTEYDMTERELRKSNMITGKEKIAGKEFYVFVVFFLNNLNN